MTKLTPRMVFAFLFGLLACAFPTGCRKPAPTMTLAQAIQSDNAAQVQANLRAGAEINARDDMGMPLLLLAAGRSSDVLKAMLDHKPAVDIADERTGIAPLHAAAMKFDGSGNVRLLLEAGADFNLRDKRGRTPLFLAAESGDLESVKALIAAGADVNAADQRGLTPLDAAELHRDTAKDPNVADYLKGRGARQRAAPATRPTGK